MASRMTTKIATALVDEIEALHDKINDVYRRAGEYGDVRDINVIRDAWKARQERHEAEFVEKGLLESFDVIETE